MVQTRGIRNNNPFNIKFEKRNHWLGLAGTDGKFCRFIDISYGIRAGIILLRNYIEKNNLCSVNQILSRFAPNSENRTNLYVLFINDLLVSSGFDTNHISFPSPAFLLLCRGIMIYESKYVVSDDDILSVINQFHIESTLPANFLFADNV